jgi:NADH-quinone oxidoreductase subunit C
MSDITQSTGAPEPREGLHEQRRHGVPELDGCDMPVLFPRREELLDLVRALHGDGYLVCLDVTAVDYLTYGVHAGSEGDLRASRRTLPGDQRPERFEVVYHFHAHRVGPRNDGRPGSARLRVRVQVPEDDPTVPTLSDIHPGTEAAEREVFDMFGITFTGHPDLSRILMPEDWIGHPLRKDYYSGRIPVQFKDAPAAR